MAMIQIQELLDDTARRKKTILRKRYLDTVHRMVEAGAVTDGNWGDSTIQDNKAHFVYGDLDAEVIERKWHEAHRRFYLRPRRALRILKRRDTWLRFPYYVRTAMNMLLGLGERETAPT